jgi:hypothetical protein
MSLTPGTVDAALALAPDTEITPGDTADLLTMTGANGSISIGKRPVGGNYSVVGLVPINDAGAVVESLAGSKNCVWISASTVHPEQVTAGRRGGAANIKRLLVLPLDIDFKANGINDGPAAVELVEVLAGVLGTPPAAEVWTGGGLQPWFITEPTDTMWESTGPNDPHLIELQALVKRWGRFCALVAHKKQLGQLDSVHDLSRMLRAPGTTNYKAEYDTPREVKTTFNPNATGITFNKLKTLLDAAGISEYAEDREAKGERKSDSAQWTFAATTCPYVLTIFAGWPNDVLDKIDGRHPWLLYQATRLAAAWRNGCVTEADYNMGKTILGNRFAEIVKAKTWGPPRDIRLNELSEAYNWGVEKIECKTPEQTAKELGNHTHNELTPVEFVGEPIDPAGEWAPLRTEKAGNRNPEPVPIDGLPAVMRDMITATSAAAGAPRDVVLAGALGVAAAATRGVFTGNIDGGAWELKTTALWTLALSPSGTAKGDGFDPVKKPLEQAEAEIVSQVKKENRARTVKRGTITTELSAAEKLTDEKAIARHLEALEKVQPLEVPQYIKDDVTAEALGQQMEKNGGPIALISTEGEQFITASGGYQQGSARLGLFNRAKDAERFSDGRVGREGTTVLRPVLTWVMAIQPEVMRGYASAATEGSGFLNRFLPFMPQKMGRRTYPFPAVPPEISQAWTKAITELHNVSWELHKMVTDDPDKPLEPISLRFSTEAGQLLIDLKNEIETELQNELGRYMGMVSWIAKHPTDLARIAAVLTLLENPNAVTVEARHVTAALSMFPSFVNHARAFFDVLRAVDADDIEHKALAAIIKMGQSTFTTRELHTKVRGQAWVNSVEDVRQVLADLTEGYTDTDCGPVRGPIQHTSGGRPSEAWQVHPDLLTGGR